MNKDRAINILLDFAKNYDKDWYAVDKDGLTAAIIFLEQDQILESDQFSNYCYLMSLNLFFVPCFLEILTFS